MIKNLSLFILILASFYSLSSQASAFDFYWEGNYSAEGNFISGVDLGNPSDGGDKAYINHHLFIRPEIILYEGLSFHAGLDILNGTGSVPPSSRVGHILGGDLSSSNGSYGADVPEPFLQRQIQKPRGVDISEAYIKYSHTNGELRLGRQPLSFGYGAFYNAGYNPFDHWYTNRDGISYSFNFGNLHFKPMINFLTSGFRSGDQTTEYGLKFNFIVEDSGLNIGLMYLQRNVSSAQNSLNPVFAGETGSASPATYSFFYNRERKNYRYGFEALLQDGDVGNGASLEGLGFAGEAEFNYSKWTFGSKFGYAQGDDPNDNSSVTSVAMHRNYNLGMILFNHPLGASDFDPLGTSIRGRRGALSQADFQTDLVPDTESISNAIYIAPSVSYKFSRKWDLQTTFVMAWLDETSVAGYGDVDSFLGSEVDVTVNFKPTKNIVYTTTIGFFLPGSAFEGDGSLDTSASLGIVTGLGLTF